MKVVYVLQDESSFGRLTVYRARHRAIKAFRDVVKAAGQKPPTIADIESNLSKSGFHLRSMEEWGHVTLWLREVQ